MTDGAAVDRAQRMAFANEHLIALPQSDVTETGESLDLVDV